jgi:uncharacterized membrane protein
LLFTCAQTAGTAKGVMKASNAVYRLIAALIQTVILNLFFEIRLPLAQCDHVTFEQGRRICSHRH